MTVERVLVGQIDWQWLTHCLTLMPWPTWAFCLPFSEGLKRKKKKGFFEERKTLLCVASVRLTKGELFPRVRRESESKDGHWCDEEARHDQVEEVVEGSPPDPHHEGDVQVRFGTAIVDHFVPGSRHACDKHIHYSSLAFKKHLSMCFSSVCHKNMESHPTQTYPIFRPTPTVIASDLILGQFMCPHIEPCILHCTESCFTEFHSSGEGTVKTSLEGGFGIVWIGKGVLGSCKPGHTGISRHFDKTYEFEFLDIMQGDW